ATLQLLDQVRNNEENYRWLVGATRRARRMSESGRLPEIQVDQGHQDELQARDTWIQSQQAYQRRLDGFKLLLGLPTHARPTPDDREFAEPATTVDFAPPEAPTLPGREPADAPVTLEPPSLQGGPYEIDQRRAIVLGLANRLDLRVAVGRVFDAQ